MYHYYVNDNGQSNGDHEVHRNTCYYFAQIASKTYLGYYNSAIPAVVEAKKHYSQSNGCAYCSPEAHTS